MSKAKIVDFPSLLREYDGVVRELIIYGTIGNAVITAILMFNSITHSLSSFPIMILFISAMLGYAGFFAFELHALAVISELIASYRILGTQLNSDANASG